MHSSASRRARSLPVAAAFLAVALISIAWAGDAPSAQPSKEKAASAAPPQAAPPREFDTYALVILRRGPAWTPGETEESRKIQAQHLGHLRKMAEQGKLVVAGPFGDQPDPSMRGLALYKTSIEEARKLAEEDPAVKAGRLKVEVMTWYTEKGALAFPIAASLAKPSGGK